MRYFFLFIIVCIAFSFTKDKQNEIQNPNLVIKRVVQEGEKVVFNYISDSSSLDIKSCNDSLFLYVIFRGESGEEQKLYYPVVENQSSFIVPNGTSYLTCFLYNACDKDSETYLVHVKDKKGKLKKNTFYLLMEDSVYLEKELVNHPDNFTAYSNHVHRLADQVLLGKMSDSALIEKTNRYLKFVELEIANSSPLSEKKNKETIDLELEEPKTITEKAEDLEALVGLYAFSNRQKEAQATLNKLLDKYPNSQNLSKAYQYYFYSTFIFKTQTEEHKKFENDFLTKVAQKYPHSPLGVSKSAYGTNIYAPLYKEEDIFKNIIVSQKSLPYDQFYKEGLIEHYIRAANYSEAKKLVNSYISETRQNAFIHNAPLKKKIRDKSANKETFIGNSYMYLAKIAELENDYFKTVEYLDSAYFYYNQDKNVSLRLIGMNLNKKATAQKKNGRYNESLKTYETLYQETKDDRILDSIKVLFKQTQQEEGFESYANNLKQRVENKNQDPKKLAADFSIKDMSGYEIKLSEWKGRVVVLNFWANYCLPCAAEIPYINKIWRETQTKDIIFLAVTKNTPIEVTRFAQRQKEMFSFSILPNAKELFDVNDIHLVPTTIVINKKGEVVHKESGFGGNIDKLKQVIVKELDK